MGRRDIGKREVKKTKKDTKKKFDTLVIQPPPVTVEVIRKARKAREE